MKAVISGYYGYGNLGDEAILASIVKNLREIDKSIQLTVLSADPALTSSSLGVNAVHRLRPLSVIAAILRSDVLISGGGSLLQDKTSSISLYYYLLILFIGQLFLKKTVYFGQGFGPVSNPFNRMLCRFIIRGCTMVTVRDHGSFASLDRLGLGDKVVVTADHGFLLGTSIKRAPESKIGIFVRNTGETDIAFQVAFASSVDDICRKYSLRPVFIPFQFPDDANLSADIAALMNEKAEIMPAMTTAREMIDIISSFKAAVCMRYHAAVFSVMAGTPMVCIDYDPKVMAIAKAADCPLIPVSMNKKTLSDAFDALMKDGEGMSKRLLSFSEEMKVAAELNYSLISKYIKAPASSSILGVRIDNTTYEEAADKVLSYIKDREPKLIFTPNPEIIMAGQKDKSIIKTLNLADLAVPDGIGILIASRINGIKLKERVTGIDLMIKILELAGMKDLRVFLMGSAPGVAAAAAERFPSVNIVGTQDGYFKPEQEPAVVNKIKAARPDILFVGLGAPRQERFLLEHYKEIGAPVNMVIGGSMDVLSGSIKRAPDLFVKLNMEWLYRLIQQPTRWKRQIKLVSFIISVIMHRIKA